LISTPPVAAAGGTSANRSGQHHLARRLDIAMAQETFENISARLNLWRRGRDPCEAAG